MIIVAGSLIVRENKILMVQEAKKNVMVNGIFQQVMLMKKNL